MPNNYSENVPLTKNISFNGVGIETALYALQDSLEQHLADLQTAQIPTLEAWLVELQALVNSVQAVKKAVLQIGDVQAALTLLSALFAAAHTERLAADQIRCVLEPLAERLDSALEHARHVL